MKIGIGFDLDHTLAIDNKLERVAFLRLLEILLDEGGRALGNIAQETEHVDQLLAQQRSGAFSIEDAVHRFVIERRLAPHPRFVEFFRESALRMVADFVVPLPGAKNAVRALRDGGFEVAVMTNGWNPLQELKAFRAGFDGLVIASADLGVQKPDPRTFAALCERLGTAPEHTWYVGDDPHVDVAGAIGAGLRGVWLDATGWKDPPDLPPGAYAVKSLDELLGLLSTARQNA